jgi:HJR/Mrr/RecB family endonuclease
MDAVAWLATAREILANDAWNTSTKAKKIYALTDSRRLARSAFRSVGEAYRSYKDADIPLAVKVAIPVTLSAGAILGGPSVGIAGFGSAIGMPILLVIFLGVAGITSVLEAVLSSSEAKSYVSIVALMIARDEILRRSSHAMRKAMSEGIVSPHRQECGSGDAEVCEMLFNMNPYDFEKHVMSFFQDAGLLAWATQKSNDAGVDGFARHSNGLIVVQCKRNSEENGVGRPIVQQFKGVVEENAAWRGYIVTTSYFTNEAIESASKNASVILIDLRKLLEWHRSGIDASQYS